MEIETTFPNSNVHILSIYIMSTDMCRLENDIG